MSVSTPTWAQENKAEACKKGEACSVKKQIAHCDMVIRVKNAQQTAYLKLKPKYANVLADKHKGEGIIHQLRLQIADTDNLVLEQANQLGQLTLRHNQKSDEVIALNEKLRVENSKWGRGTWTIVGVAAGVILGAVGAGIIIGVK